MLRTGQNLEDEALHEAVDQAQRYVNRNKKPDLKPDQTRDETGQNMMTDEETSECLGSSEVADLQRVNDDLGRMTKDEQEREKVERKRFELSTYALRTHRSPN